MKKGYFLNGRYFSKTLSLSRFKRGLSLSCFSAVPLPLGTPEHPILPVTHATYPAVILTHASVELFVL